ncbi:MAG: hypothetical protein AAB529_02810 [Patescibacteria group bacterium]
MSFREFILKLQGLPDKRKKIIMWIIVAVLGIIMVFFWFDSAAKRVSKLGEGLKKIELPQIENQIPDVKTEKKDETADWKTYTDDEYGFEFKYPADYSVIVPGDSQYEQGGSQWTVFSDKSKGGFVFNTMKTSDLNIDSNQIIGTTNIGGVEGEIIISKGACYDIFVEKGKITFIFTDCQKDKTVFNQILSTFKFIK